MIERLMTAVHSDSLNTSHSSNSHSAGLQVGLNTNNGVLSYDLQTTHVHVIVIVYVVIAIGLTVIACNCNCNCNW